MQEDFQVTSSERHSTLGVLTPERRSRPSSSGPDIKDIATTMRDTSRGAPQKRGLASTPHLQGSCGFHAGGFSSLLISSIRF
jgi:hypothetical protein